MSNKVDERITRIRFDNDQFERGVATSMQSLDRLKNKLESTESVEAFTGIQKTADKIDFGGLEKAINSVGDKFSYLRMVAINVLSDIASKAVNTGISLVKNLSTDNIAAGWEKYDQEVQAVQTIMVTLDDTTIEEVEDHLKKVGWYADETSYSYTEMVGAMSKLISSGVGLEDATDAVLGIANAAAAAGVSTKKAQQAFYNFSQAFGAGYMQLLDWRSIELLNMGTPQFKKNIIRTAVELGKIVDLGNDMYVAADKYGTKNWEKSIFNANNMRESLSDKWFDKDVMNEVLKSYTNFTNKVYELQTAEKSEYDQASDVIKALKEQGENLDEYSAKAFIAGQEAKTFAEAIDSIKDAVSTKWKDTFKSLFGNYEQAKVLWTDVADKLYKLFAASGDVRNEILDQWNDPLSFMVPDAKVRKAYKFPELEAGKDILIKGLWNIFNSIVNVIDLIKSAWREVFPQLTAKKLYDFTKSFRDFTEKVLNATKNMEGVRSFLVGLFTVFRKVLNGAKIAIGSLKHLWPILKKVGDIISVVAKQVWQFFKDARNYIKGTGKFNSALEKMEGVFTKFKTAILAFDESKIHLPTFEDFLNALEKIRIATADFRKKITDIISHIKDKFTAMTPSNIIGKISIAITALIDSLKNLEFHAGPTLTNIKNFFIDTWTVIFGILSKISGGIKAVADWFVKQFQGISIRDILGVTVLGAMTWFTVRLGIMVGRVGELLENFSELIWSFAKVVNAKAFAIRIEAIRNLGLAVLALAGAMYLISQIDDPGRFTQAVISVVAMVGALVAISIVMARVESKLKLQGTGIGVTWTKEKGLSLNGGLQRRGIGGLVLGVLGMALAIKLMADTMNNNNLTPDRLNSLQKIVTNMAYVLAACVGVMQFTSGVAAKFSGGKAKSSTFAPLALASAMLVMIHVFERLDKMKIENVGKVLIGMLGIIGTLALFSLAVGRINSSVGLGMIGIVGSIYLILLALEKLGTMDIDLSEHGDVIIILSGLLLVLGIISAITSKGGTILQKGQRFRSGKNGMLGVILGLVACVAAIEILGRMDTIQLAKGGVAVLILMTGLFIGLTSVIEKANQAGKYAGRGLLAISVLTIIVTLMYGLVSVITYLTPTDWWKPMAVIAVMLGGISLICAALNRKEFSVQNKSIWAVTAIILGLGGIITALYFFNKQDSKAASEAVSGLASLMIGLGAMIALIGTSTNDSLISGARQILTNIAILLIELGGTVVALSYFVKDANKALYGATAVGILAVTLGIAVGLIGKIPILEQPKKMFANIAAIGVLAAALGAVVIGLSKWVNGDNLWWLKDYGNQLLVAVSVITMLGVVLGGIGSILDPKIVLKGALIFLEATGLILLVVGALYGLDAAIRGMAGDDSGYETFKERLAQLPELARTIGTTFGALYESIITGNLPDIGLKLSEFSENIKPFTENIATIPDGFFGKLTAVVGGLTEFLGAGLLTLLLDSPLGDEMMLRKFKRMGKLFDSDSLFAKMKDFGNMDSLMGGIEAIAKLGPAVKDLNDAKFNNLEGTVYPGLDLLSTKMKEFGENLKVIDQTTMDKITWITTAFNGIGDAAHSFYSEYGGVFDLEGISDQIEYLGTGLATYLDATKEVSEADVDRTEIVYNLLSEFLKINDVLGKNNGAIPWLTGWSDVGKFGRELGELVDTGLDKYFKALHDLPLTTLMDTKVKTPAVAQIIKQIADLGKIIGPNTGLAWLSGVTDYSIFAEDLGHLAEGIVNYAAKLVITNSDAQRTADITNQIADAIANLSGAAMTENITKFKIALKDLADNGIQQFTDAFKDNGVSNKMSEAVNNMLAQFGKAISALAEKGQYIYGLLAPLFTSIFDAIGTAAIGMYDKGTEFFGKFIDGMTGIEAKAKLQTFTDELAEGGENAIIGLANGMKNEKQKVLDAIDEVNKPALAKFKTDWKEQSPSKVTTQDGYYIGLGLAKGITDSTPMVLSAIGQLNAGSTKLPKELFRA